MCCLCSVLSLLYFGIYNKITCLKGLLMFVQCAFLLYLGI